MSKPDKAYCIACKRDISLNDNGTFRRHKGGDEFDQQTDRVCSWSGLYPEPPTSCCGASHKGSANSPTGVCCRQCYRPIDPSTGKVVPG